MKDSSNFKSFKMKFQVEFYFQNFEKCKIPIFINFGFGGGCILCTLVGGGAKLP